MIYETIISSVNAQGQAHVTPFGVREENDLIVIAPFKPSSTLDNIIETRAAVINLTDDVRIFASAIVKHHQDYLLTKASKVIGYRLAHTLSHKELRLIHVKEHKDRPELHMQVVHQATHQPFSGFNRAQAAVIELAVLASRLAMLPKEKIMTEMDYLQIAIDKTAGTRELEAWQWLTEKVDQYYADEASS